MFVWAAGSNDSSSRQFGSIVWGMMGEREVGLSWSWYVISLLRFPFQYFSNQHCSSAPAGYNVFSATQPSAPTNEKCWEIQKLKFIEFYDFTSLSVRCLVSRLSDDLWLLKMFIRNYGSAMPVPPVGLSNPSISTIPCLSTPLFLAVCVGVIVGIYMWSGIWKLWKLITLRKIYTNFPLLLTLIHTCIDIWTYVYTTKPQFKFK